MADAQAEKVVDIPGVGTVGFPSSMSDDQINAAASRLYSQANAGKDEKPPKPKSWIDSAVDWLPAIGGTVGASVGGPKGAAVGGMAGQGYRTIFKNAPQFGAAVKDVASGMLHNPVETMKGFGEGVGEGATDAMLQGGAQGGAAAIGGAVANGASAVAEKVAPALMQGALKPAAKLTREAFKYGQTPPVVKTLLDEGINVSKAGVRKLNEIISAAPAASARQDAAVVARNATAERLSQLANTDPEGLLQLLVLRHPAIPSLIARGLWKSAGNAVGLPGKLIRDAVATVMQGAGSAGAQATTDTFQGQP